MTTVDLALRHTDLDDMNRHDRPDMGAAHAVASPDEEPHVVGERRATPVFDRALSAINLFDLFAQQHIAGFVDVRDGQLVRVKRPLLDAVFG